MSPSGLSTGSPRENDGRLILTGQTDSKGWITSLKDYVNSMKEGCPDENHPNEEWLSAGFAMILLDQERTVTTPPKQGSLAVTGQGSGDSVSSQLSGMQRRLDVRTSGVANSELVSQPAHQNQRTKDRTFRVHAFSNKAAQFHAADLYDIETCTMEVSKSAKGLAPYLAL